MNANTKGKILKLVRNQSENITLSQPIVTEIKNKQDSLSKEKYYDLPVIITEGEAGYYIAEIPLIPGCYSQGNTFNEALTNIKEAAKLCLACQEGEDWSLPNQYYIEHITVGTECQKSPESQEKSVSLHLKGSVTS